jgi:hypothetical protein
MPAANAPFLLSKFIEGYQEGAQKSQLMRLEKAKGLMAMAQQQAELADKSENAEGRSVAWQSARKAMDEAEKMMSGSDGLWKTLTKVFGGKGGGKGDLQDPHDLLRQFGHEPGGSYKTTETPVGGQPQKQVESGATETAGGGLPAPPAAQDQSQPQPPQTNKDGVPVERPAPAALGGPTMGTQTLPEPRQPTIPVAMYQPPKPPQGVKPEKDASGEGLEKVLNSRGLTEFRLNGQQISADRFNKLQDQFAVMGLEQSFRSKERSVQFQQELQQIDARAKAQESGSLRTANAYATKIGRDMTDQERDNYNYIAFGAKPLDRKLDIQKFTKVDQRTGKIYESYKYRDPNTGMVLADKPGPIEDQEVPPNEMGFRIQGIMASKKVDYPAAIGLLGRDLENDNELQNQVKKLQVQGMATSNAMNRLELDTKQRYAKGEFTKQEFIDRAYKESKDWVKLTNPNNMTVAFAALKQHMFQAYGLQWEDWTRSIGQPQQIFEDIANSYLNKTGSQTPALNTIPGSVSGGRYIPR